MAHPRRARRENCRRPAKAAKAAINQTLIAPPPLLEGHSGCGTGTAVTATVALLLVTEPARFVTTTGPDSRLSPLCPDPSVPS